MIKFYLATSLLLVLCASMPRDLHAEVSQASVISSELSLAPATVSAVAAIEGGQWVLVGLDASGEAATAVIESAVDGSRLSLTVSAGLLSDGAELIGRSVTYAAELGGASLWVGSELLLFIPSEALLAHYRQQRLDR